MQDYRLGGTGGHGWCKGVWWCGELITYLLTYSTPNLWFLELFLHYGDSYMYRHTYGSLNDKNGSLNDSEAQYDVTCTY